MPGMCKVDLYKTVKSRYLEVDGTIFYKFKLPALRVIWTCKKVSNAKAWLEKAIKMYF